LRIGRGLVVVGPDPEHGVNILILQGKIAMALNRHLK